MCPGGRKVATLLGERLESAHGSAHVGLGTTGDGAGRIQTGPFDVHRRLTITSSAAQKRVRPQPAREIMPEGPLAGVPHPLLDERGEGGVNLGKIRGLVAELPFGAVEAVCCQILG